MTGGAMRTEENGLALFCKHWTPGRIKTRWGSEIGMERAAAAARVFQECLVHRLATKGDRRILVYSPSNQAAEYRHLAGAAWQCVEQSDGDLGQRLSGFASRMLGEVKRLVILGSDSPDIPPDYIEQAFALLQQLPVVLGPAQDGGYYLVGMSRFVPELFDAIPWSTSRVFAESCDRLRRVGVAFGALPMWDDVDDHASWMRVRDRWRRAEESSREWIEKLDRILEVDIQEG